jgi:DNA invertase Pin-like site-specific DNA recombinase
VLQVLAFAAENERDNIRTRQREGIDAAKAKGVKFGRPRVGMPENFDEICSKWRYGMITTEQAAQECGVSRSTLYKRYHELIGAP